MQRSNTNPAIDSPDWKPRDTAFLAAIVAIFVASRVAWIVWMPETALYWEESYRWFAAHELLTGPMLPFLDYQADHYQGGSLFVILVALPFFALAGESLLSLKLGAVLLSTASLVTLFVLNFRFFGRTASRLTCLAYLAGPPLVAFWGIALMGFHPDSALLSLLQVCAFLGLLTGRWRHAVGWVAFGAACGAGFSFTYITALSAAACALTWLALERIPRLRELLWAAAGFAVGLLPWLAYNATHDFAGVERILEVFGASAATVDPWQSQSLLDRIADLMVTMPTRGLLDPTNSALPIQFRPFVLAGFLIPVILALFSGIGRSARLMLQRLLGRGSAGDEIARREFVFSVYAFLFTVTYLASEFTLVGDHPIDYRLFPPLAVLLMTPVGVTAARMMSRTGLVRRVAVFAAAVCLASSAFATVGFAFWSPASGNVTLEDGYKVYGRLLHRKYADLSQAVALAVYDDPELQKLIWWGIGWEVHQRFEVAGELDDVAASIRELPTSERHNVLEGIFWTSERRLESLEANAEPNEQDLLASERLRVLSEFTKPELKKARAAVKKKEAHARERSAIPDADSRGAIRKQSP